MVAYRDSGACGLEARWPLRLLASTALIAVAALSGGAPARSQSATWNTFAGSGDFNTATNWTPTGTPTGTAFFGASNVTSLIISAATTVGDWTFKTGAPGYDFNVSQALDFTGAGIVIIGGSAAIMNFDQISFHGASAAGSAQITSQLGAVNFLDNSTAATAAITNVPGGSLYFRNAGNAGSATILNLWLTEFYDTSSAANATITSNGAINFRDASMAGDATITNGGGIQFFDTSSAGNATITNTGSIEFLGSSTGGTARFINSGSIDLSQLTSSGITAGSIEGAGDVFLGSKNLTVGGNGLPTTISGVLQDGGTSGGTGGSLTKVGAGTLTLTGVNTYTGSTIVNGGTLMVDGSTVASAQTIVNAGGTLGGTGTIGSTTVTGGTLAPGASIGTLAVQGSLAFTTAATYLVEVSPSNADRTNVTGAATLAGTVNAVFAPGSYIARNYTILSATGGLGGRFNAITTTNLPGNFAASLSYNGNDVLLNVTGALGSGSNLGRNQQSVADAISNFFNGGGTLPPVFTSMFGLTGPALGNVLTQLSGEVATGVQQTSIVSTGLFLNQMLDPFVAGRAGGIGAGLGFAPEPRSRVQVAAQDALAAALPVKAPPLVPTSERRWSVWGAAYGGRNRTDGDTGVGSNDLAATAAGFAMGADYRISPDTVLGLATAVGETRWSVAGLGKGNADVAQFGGYASTRWSSYYLSGAVAAAWYRASTDRTVTIVGTDRLEADFDANSVAGRVEGGRRFATTDYGFTPYAALQVQSVRTPGYSEVATAGSNQFALDYAAQTATNTRSELGFWADKHHLLAGGATLVLRGRAAWVHDFNPDARVNAAFQTLPGASFTVDGAQAPRESALTSAVAELRMTNGVTLTGKFDGEFSGRSHTIAGTGTMRYAW